MGTKTITVAGGAWSNSGTWDPPGQPQNTDNVKARTQGDSGNVTIDINAACRSINLDGYHGTLTHNPLKSLTIGDGTASDTGFALKFVLDMTYTLVDPTSAPIAFVSSAPGTQTVDFAGKRTGDVTFDHPSGSWQL